MEPDENSVIKQIDISEQTKRQIGVRVLPKPMLLLL